MTKVMDSLAIGLSALCIVHCLAVPILIVALPGVLTGSAHSDMTHFVIFAVAVPLSAVALSFGYRLHRRLRYIGLAALGICGLGMGLMLHGLIYEVYATITGALILALAHMGNRFASRLV